MKTDIVKLQVTDKGAVYVNDGRITDRSRKYASHHTILETECYAKDVMDVLDVMGFGNLLIDPDYAEEAGVK